MADQDVTDFFKKQRLRKQERGRQRLTLFDEIKAEWTQHSDYHFSRVVNGVRIDYWPSTGKYTLDNKRQASRTHNIQQDVIAKL